MEEREEMMTTDLAEVNEEETNSEGGIGTGLAMLIGSGLTLAAIVGVNKARKAWKRRKCKSKEAVEDEWPDDGEEDFVDSTCEEVEEFE